MIEILSKECQLKGSDHNNDKLVQKEITLLSTLTCPHCGHQKDETMPTDACQFFYECENCHKVLKPKEGDCCVFCSYGTVSCPPIQEGGKSNCC